MTRLSPALEVSAMVRAVNQAGGFAAVINKGDADHGSVLVVAVENGANARLFERMPSLDGGSQWAEIRPQAIESDSDISQYLVRRAARDPDMWIVELDIVQAERFIDSSLLQG